MAKVKIFRMNVKDLQKLGQGKPLPTSPPNDGLNHNQRLFDGEIYTWGSSIQDENYAQKIKERLESKGRKVKVVKEQYAGEKKPHYAVYVR